MISARIQDPPSLSQLASTVGLSRTYFSTIFRQVMGMGLQEYLIQARLNKAKELLQYPELEIKQIAYEVGFKDPDYFCRIFKMKTGQNPTQWRLMNIEEAKKLQNQNNFNKL
jgi:two-component system response regulator YesN